MIIGGINAWEWLGQETPSWWTWFTNNKIYACMMVFFLCNAIEGQLVSTGAFEISFNGEFFFSNDFFGRRAMKLFLTFIHLSIDDL